jgi:hypothetical protein
MDAVFIRWVSKHTGWFSLPVTAEKSINYLTIASETKQGLIRFCFVPSITDAPVWVPKFKVQENVQRRQ